MTRCGAVKWDLSNVTLLFNLLISYFGGIGIVIAMSLGWAPATELPNHCSRKNVDFFSRLEADRLRTVLLRV